MFGTGGVVSLLGVSFAGAMFVFNDANLPADMLFSTYVAPMSFTIAGFGLVCLATALTIGMYSRQRMAGPLLLAAALGLYLVSVPAASAAFQVAWRIASNV